MHRIAAFLVLTSAICSFAQEEAVAVSEPAMYEDVSSPSFESMDCCCAPMIILTPARGCADPDIGLYINAEILVWQARVEQMQYALFNTLGSSGLPGGVPGSVVIKDVRFNWNQGYRCGLGYNSCHDDWDLNINWTSYENYSKTQTHVPFSEGFISDLYLPDSAVNVFTAGTNHWKFHFKTLEGTWGRSFYLSEHLSIRPGAGVEAAWINQTTRVEFLGKLVTLQTPNFYLNKNDFKGVGPRFGIDSAWSFDGGLRLVANYYAAFLYGKTKAVQHNIVFRPPSTISRDIPATFNQHFFRTVNQFQLGLAWEMCFDCSYNLNIHAVYEGQIWWDQMVAPRSSSSAVILNSNGNLMLHGLTAGFRFDF